MRSPALFPGRRVLLRRPALVPGCAILLALGLAAGSAGCRRENVGQTAVLLTLGTAGPVDCVSISEVAGGATPDGATPDGATPDGGAAGGGAADAGAFPADGGPSLRQQLDLSTGLPSEFAGGLFRKASLTALIYSGNALGSAAVTLVAEGHRGGCKGPLVARFGPAAAGFTQGEVVPLQGTLALLGIDADGDGYALPEDCNDNDPTIHPGAPELCDGKDHSCSGVIDKGCPCHPGEQRRCYTKGPAQLAGVGRCSYGQQTCGADRFFGPCEGDIAPLPYELCNGVDDNCNGQIDEEIDAAGKPLMVRPPCSQQEGVCAGAKKHCIGSNFAGCGTAEYQSAALAHGSVYGSDSFFCDGADHDCDGTIDTGCNRPCPSAGATRDCYGPGLQSPTLQHLPCKMGSQTCLRTGSKLVWGACTNEIEPAQELCDGVDNDCNGQIDDLVKNEGQACATGRPGLCAQGARHCAEGQLGCAPVTPATAEVCNGLDDNCDGRVDELWDKQHDPAHCGGPNECRACDTGDACCVGRCADLQVDALNCGSCGNACAGNQGCCAGHCAALDTTSDCGACGRACDPGLACRTGQCAPAHELICNNGVDDDRDGKTDCQDPDCRGHRCAGNGVCTSAGACVVESCHNGVDDNGDGKIDCQDAVACPPPGGATSARCCNGGWTDVDHGDTLNCGSCGHQCPAAGGQCGVAACNPGGVCGAATDCNKPGCDGAACSAGGKGGVCAGGQCCTGCLDQGNACLGGKDLHACVNPSGACEDCSPTNNVCVTDQCTAAGCTHINNSNACFVNGNPGKCSGGSCCTGCFDAASGACQAISPAHCGKPGQQCLAQGCVDGGTCQNGSCQ